jgi:hypothetical protein
LIEYPEDHRIAQVVLVYLPQEFGTRPRPDDPRYGDEPFYIDVENIEIYTRPMLLGGTIHEEAFRKEIARIYENLKELTEIFSEAGGSDVGVFLPRTYHDETPERRMSPHSLVTKHVSISPALPRTRRRNPFAPFIDLKKDTPESIRMHFKVPYNFNDYLGLARAITSEMMKFRDLEMQFEVIKEVGREYLYEWSLTHPMDAPIFLGSSRAGGGRFKQHHRLI